MTVKKGYWVRMMKGILRMWPFGSTGDITAQYSSGLDLFLQRFLDSTWSERIMLLWKETKCICFSLNQNFSINIYEALEVLSPVISITAGNRETLVPFLFAFPFLYLSGNKEQVLSAWVSQETILWMAFFNDHLWFSVLATHSKYRRKS